MREYHSTPPVVVGVDGSPAALGAAVWAAREAAGRDVPLRLVHVIYTACHAEHSDTDQLAAAHAALSQARHAVESSAATVRVETEVLWGNPLAVLIELSRSATMVCVGSVGVEQACHRAGSTAAALAGSAGCPVAVIRRGEAGPAAPRPSDTGYIVAEVDACPGDWPDNNAVLGWAMAEAKLRGAPLKAITACEAGAARDDAAAQAALNRRITHWARRYPEVPIEAVVVPDGITQYLAGCLVEQADSIQLFVSGTRDRRSLGWPGDAGGCSVLTVSGTRL